jgi:uncharacterized protein YkwD
MRSILRQIDASLILAAALPPAARADDAAIEYATSPRPNGVVGGAAARELSKAVAAALRARGDAAAADGALASAAAWFVGANAEGRRRGAELAARRAGFVGAVLTSAAFPIGESETWREALAALARNVPVTRYGIHVSPDGRVAGVVFGDVAVELAPFARHLRAGDTLRLRGEVARRFERASVHVTRADGSVTRTRLPGRRIDKDVPLPRDGVYRVEVMGDGATGPVVVANVPVYVGVPEPTPEAQMEAARSGAAPRSAEEAQARMLALLNDARRAAGLPALLPDAELAKLALAHSREMAAAHFFGHQSPTTGRVEDRLRRAGVSVTKLGENISQGDTADAAHAALMGSPSHRANMLDPGFTHVGIGVVLRPTERPALLVTMVFARRPRTPAGPLTSAAVRDFVSARRRARGLGPLRFDPLLERAAEAGIEVVRKAGGPVVASAALDATHAALATETRRLGQARPAVCAQLAQVLELDELEADPLLTEAQPGRVGLAAATRKVGNDETVFILTVVESTKCK